MKEELITLQQAPIIIYEKIKQVGQQIEAKIKELNLDNQLVTEYTLKGAKVTRADLRKELADFEQQRKFIKEKVNEPYEAFERAYKEHIKAHYDNADSTLKAKIDFVENRLKDDKRARIKEYFTELCNAQNTEFLTFERLNLNIPLSDSDKKLKEQVAGFVGEVTKSLELIESLSETDELKAEILTEYKQTLDVTTAVRNAQYRKQQREAELQRIEAQRVATEQARLAAEQARQATAPLQAPTPVQQPAPAPLQAPTPVQQPAPAPQEQPTETEPTQAPELLQATFTVVGTMEQLKALKQYIISNNIQIL